MVVGDKRSPRFVKPGALIRIWGPRTLGPPLVANAAEDNCEESGDGGCLNVFTTCVDDEEAKSRGFRRRFNFLTLPVDNDDKGGRHTNPSVDNDEGFNMANIISVLDRREVSDITVDTTRSQVYINES